MIATLLSKYQSKANFIFLLMMLAGICLAEIAPSICSISMILIIVYNIICTYPKKLFSSFINRKDCLIFSLGYVFLLSSFFYSTELSYLLERLQIKIPLLLLPLVIPEISISEAQKKNLLLSFSILTLLISLGTFIHFLLNYEAITASYLEAKVMPGPLNHIRFSLMIAFATYTSYYLLTSGFYLNKLLRYILICGGVFLFVFIHIYSVRSGIIACYAIFIFETIRLVVKYKAYTKGLIAMVSLVVFVMLALMFSKTLQNKITDTKKDFDIYFNHGYANYSSITTRFFSYEIAFEIVKSNPYWGCGLGNIYSLNDKMFRERYPVISNPILPHNQFIFYMAATGIIGLLIFIVSFFFPLIYKRNKKNTYLQMHMLVLFLSFQTEPMLETQLGVAYAVFFLIVALISVSEE